MALNLVNFGNYKIRRAILRISVFLAGAVLLSHHFKFGPGMWIGKTIIPKGPLFLTWANLLAIVLFLVSYWMYRNTA